MSGLIFKGDVIQSTGEYLPAPYINKIVVTQNSDIANAKLCEYSTEIYIFADDYSFVNVFENGSIQASKEAYREYLSRFNYYIMAISGLSEQEYSDLFNNKTNPLYFYKNYEDDKAKYSGINAALYQFDALETNSVEEIYDENDNKITIHSTTINSTEINVPKITFNTETYSVEIDAFSNNIEYIFCFCSIFDYNNDSVSIESDNFNLELLKLQTSDVSYERVYTSGDSETLENEEKIKFYDSENVLYDRVPLASIQQQIYKISKLTHDDIKDSINSLLEEYSAQYNSEFGFEELQKEMNKIYSVLSEHGDEYDIVPRLEEIRVSFSDKNPSTPVGKFYKRYAKRIYDINRSVKDAENLFKKLVYNTKIHDQRPVNIPDPTEPSMSETGQFIYSKPDNFTNLGVDDGEQSVIAGYFFFDYEKALRQKSFISNYLDINKIEYLGFNVSYESFSIKQIKINRDGSEDKIGAICTSKTSEDKKYPIIAQIDYGSSQVDYNEYFYLTPHQATEIYRNEQYNEDIESSIFYGSSETNSNNDDAALGFVTSVINRSYAYTPSDAFEINNYRLMLFEVLDYRTANGSFQYDIEIIMEDRTISQFESMFNVFEEKYLQYESYVSTMDDFCVYDQNIEKFNTFFVENVVQEFGNSENSIWYTAPVIYTYFADILYNLYDGETDRIEEASKTIVGNVNPHTGNPEAAKAFKESISQMYRNLKNIKNQMESDLGSRSFEPPPKEIRFSNSVVIEDSQDKLWRFWTIETD
jgi:hypothetical protein